MPKVRKAKLSFLYMTRRLVLFYISDKYHRNIPKGIPELPELLFLYLTRPLVLFYISTQYHKNIQKGLVILVQDMLTYRADTISMDNVNYNKGR